MQGKYGSYHIHEWVTTYVPMQGIVRYCKICGVRDKHPSIWR